MALLRRVVVVVAFGGIDTAEKESDIGTLAGPQITNSSATLMKVKLS